MDIIYHLAAACLRTSISEPEMVHEVNATGSLHICQAALFNHVPRLIYVSSSEVYGTAKLGRISEKHPLEPTTPYAASKLAGELYARSFYLTHQLPVIVVRPFNTYGPREHFAGMHGEVIPRFIARVANLLPPVIFGDGKQTRDFTYISDTVAGIVLASQCDGLIGDVINIARGREVSINEIARIVLQEFGKGELEVQYHPPRL
jgi:UDP-glucose 4-epimerase